MTMLLSPQHGVVATTHIYSRNKDVTAPHVYQIHRYNTIQYKTCKAPYVTRMLFVGAGMRRG